MDTIQIRIDGKVKKAAQKIFADSGMDLSTGMRIFLSNVVKTKNPFGGPRTVNGFTPAQEERLLRELEHTKNMEKAIPRPKR